MTERWCSFVIEVAWVFITVNWFIGQVLSVQTVVITGILLIENALLWHAQRIQFHRTDQSVYRPNASSGILNVLLMPMALMGELSTRRQLKDCTYIIKEFWLNLVIVAVIILRFTLAECSPRWKVLLVACSSFGAFLATLYGWITILSLVVLYITWKCLELVPCYLPKSFTFGELAAVLQILVSWINRMGLSIFQAQILSPEDAKLVWFICTLVIAVMIATMIVYLMDVYSSLWHFVAVYTVAAVISLIFLQSVFSGNPVLWLLNFVFGPCTKILLLATWIILFSVVIVWTVIRGLEHSAPGRDTSFQRYIHTEGVAHGTIQDRSSSSFSNMQFIVRKVFHVFIALVYIPGLVLDVRLLLLASTAVFALFIILEAARALHVPLVGEHLDKIMRTFVDDRDQGLVFLTHIYLLTGMSLPLWISHHLFSSQRAPIELYSGILSLGIGDTVACVAGKVWGRTHWPGSKKTLEGTLLSIIAQMTLVILGYYIGIVSITSWLNVIIGISLCALVEAFTDQIDNLILPLVFSFFTGKLVGRAHQKCLH